MLLHRGTAGADDDDRRARAERLRRGEHVTEQQRVVQRFLAALTGGDVQGLLDVLAPDVVLEIIGRDAGRALDADVVRALGECWAPQVAAPAVALAA